MSRTSESPFGAASFDSLTPLTFLRRSAVVHADRTAYVFGDRERSYAEFAIECRSFAGALMQWGIEPGDRVAVLAPNTPLMLRAQFAVAMAGGVITPINVRLSAGEVAAIVSHSGARILIHDDELSGLSTAVSSAEIVSESRFDELVRGAAEVDLEVPDEMGLLSLNYTSGTTGAPKGVMAHHRGAYLQALSMTLHAQLRPESRYLWTLPMFHCNGWAFPWAVTAAGATHVCVREVEPTSIWAALNSGTVSHLCAAPTVLTMLSVHPDRRRVEQRVWIATGGAPPAPKLIGELEELGLTPTHLYGLTECFGPAVINEPKPAWESLSGDGYARAIARQGSVNIVGRNLRVLDTEDKDVAADGESVGEVILRGNNVSLGYFQDAEATEKAMGTGWFRTGDLGVLHPDGTLELKDRAKDVIISGGENIASIEVEQALASHPAVLECAVVAAPDEKWGERPVAFVTLRPAMIASTEELIAYVRGRIAHFKAPREVFFGVLPKSGTGKILKFRLREEARRHVADR